MAEPVVLDVDGTVCFDGRTIAQDIADALRDLASHRSVIFASARPIRDLLPVIPHALRQCTLLGGNGAFTRHRGSLHVVGLSDAARRALDAIIDEFSLGALVDGDWDYAYTGPSSHRILAQLDAGGLAVNVSRSDIATYAKVVLFSTAPDVLRAVRATGLPCSVHESEGTIDIAPHGIDKHSALRALGIQDDAYVAFGNDANDVELLSHARVGYRVGAHPALVGATHTIEPREVARTISSLVPGSSA